MVGGQEGLDRQVRAVNVMEVPDILDWVQPDELLLTTAYPLRHDPVGLDALIPRLAERGLAGIAVKPARYIESIPNGMIEAADRHANLGLLYAFMGREADAIREGRLAVQLKPEAKDANDGAIMLCYLALIYARVGEVDQAIPLIDQLLKTPGAVDSVNYSITLNDLRHRWEWDPLRKDARFLKLLQTP